MKSKKRALQESPTFFDLLDESAIPSAGITKTETEQATLCEQLYEIESEYSTSMTLEDYQEAFDDGRISTSDYPLNAEATTDLTLCAATPVVNIHLDKYVYGQSLRRFDAEKWAKDALLCAHVSDNLAELRYRFLSENVKKLQKEKEKNLREIKLIQHIESEAFSFRPIHIRLSEEKELWNEIALGEAYVFTFFNAIRKLERMRLASESIALAKARKPFPAFSSSGDIENTFTLQIKKDSRPLFDEMIVHGRRNSFVL